MPYDTSYRPLNVPKIDPTDESDPGPVENLHDLLNFVVPFSFRPDLEVEHYPRWGMVARIFLPTVAQFLGLRQICFATL